MAASIGITTVGGEGAIRNDVRGILSKGGSREQKIQEAIVGATFLSIFQRLVSPVMGRMARINEEALDIEARTVDGVIYQFEITTAYPPGYRIREAYRNGSKREIPWSAFPGEPIL